MFSTDVKKVFKIIFFCVILFSCGACKTDSVIPEQATSTKQINVTVLIKNLENPWGMAFLPNGDFLFNERSGNINLLKKGNTDHNVIMVRDVEVSEGGLLGLAIDPDFNNNHFVYIYETITGSNQVVRLNFENNVLSQDQVIVAGIPAADNHDGGALSFGPDGYLYLGTGDATSPNLAQDKNSLAGKILRLDRNGNPPPGNPFNSPVWSYGHRNVQGFDWNKQGEMIATEHGPTGEFGWCCHDEINLIEAGKNYGWPIAIGGTESDSLVPPIYQSGLEVWAPSGCTFIEGAEWGTWENNFIFGALKGERLVRIAISPDGANVQNRQDTLIGTYQRLRNIIQAPDGSLLFSSSNKGTFFPPSLSGDDKIYKMSVE